MTVYLTAIEVVVMHRVLIERFGGTLGLRDAGALESALFRPQSGYYGDVIAEAAALFESLAMSHPFVDGNKRIAFACLDVFLRANGVRLKAKPATLLRWIVANLKKGTFQLATIEPWLRKNTRKA